MVEYGDNLQQCDHLQPLGALEQARVPFWERDGRISEGVFFEPARIAINTRNKKSVWKRPTICELEGLQRCGLYSMENIFHIDFDIWGECICMGCGYKLPSKQYHRRKRGRK